MLARFRRLLKPGALLILGDIVPPSFGAPVAALSLLRFAAANGFFFAALRGLIRIFVSDYLRLKKQDRAVALRNRPCWQVARLRLCRDARRRNIGHNQWRMTLLARPLTG